MKVTTSFLFSALVLNSTSVYSATVEGNYRSLDGSFKHKFSSSGDYWGRREYSNSPPSEIEGVYEVGQNICANTRDQYGNIKLYFDGAQCCLNIKPISDKYAVSKIWKDGRGTGFALCNDHVLRKVE